MSSPVAPISTSSAPVSTPVCRICLTSTQDDAASNFFKPTVRDYSTWRGVRSWWTPRRPATGEGSTTSEGPLEGRTAIGEEKLIEPCRCRGTIRYVHFSCLQRWCQKLSESRENTANKCSICGAQYLLPERQRQMLPVLFMKIACSLFVCAVLLFPSGLAIRDLSDMSGTFLKAHSESQGHLNITPGWASLLDSVSFENLKSTYWADCIGGSWKAEGSLLVELINFLWISSIKAIGATIFVVYRLYITFFLLSVLNNMYSAFHSFSAVYDTLIHSLGNETKDDPGSLLHRNNYDNDDEPPNNDATVVRGKIRSGNGIRKRTALKAALILLWKPGSLWLSLQLYNAWFGIVSAANGPSHFEFLVLNILRIGSVGIALADYSIRYNHSRFEDTFNDFLDDN